MQITINYTEIQIDNRYNNTIIVKTIRTIYKLKNIRDRSFFREWGAGGIKERSPKEKWLQGVGHRKNSPSVASNSLGLGVGHPK